jgi:hypothetical protein
MFECWLAAMAILVVFGASGKTGHLPTAVKVATRPLVVHAFACDFLHPCMFVKGCGCADSCDSTSWRTPCTGHKIIKVMRLQSSGVFAKQFWLLDGHCAAELVCVGQPPEIMKVALHGCWELERGSQDSLIFLFSGQVLHLHVELRHHMRHCMLVLLLFWVAVQL